MPKVASIGSVLAEFACGISSTRFQFVYVQPFGLTSLEVPWAMTLPKYHPITNDSFHDMRNGNSSIKWHSVPCFFVANEPHFNTNHRNVN